jgi:hypothetical protein
VFLDAFGAVGSFTPSPRSKERRLSRSLAKRRQGRRWQAR